jgi:hypothetical protein
MASKLTTSLKVDLPALAELLRSKGRGRDTMLAHITPKEAALLKRRGGRGSINPDTGLPEYEDDYVDSGSVDVSPAPASYETAPAVDPGAVYTQTEQAGPTYAELGYTPQYTYEGGGDVGPTYSELGYSPAYGPTYGELGYTPGALPAAYDPMQASQEGFTYGGSMGQTLPTGGIYGQDYASVYAPITYSQQDLQRISEGESPEAQFKALSEEDQNKVRKEAEKTGKSWWETLAGLAAAGLIGLGLTKKQQQAGTQAAQQAQQAADKIQQIGVPYKTMGTNLISGAQRGELSAANQQIVNAARAQAAQNIKRRGGVGVLQYANSIADLTDRLLQSQFQQGLAVSQIGDNYALQAIQTGLSGSQAVNQANSQFYNQLAQLLGPTILTSFGGTAPTAAQRPTGITA